MWEDPIVQEVRRERERLSAQFNFDVHAIFEDLRRRQALLGAKLVKPQKRKEAKQPAAPGRNSTGLHPGR